ncbi:MAG: hypothetical protein KFB93_01390 [Simkaniaceae bacterium]|nr:MAG: hypothetical protein KFB93_01390 [Simkaniaceae bacterium]
MSQKLTYTTYKPPHETADQASVVASPMSLIWGLFSTLSKCCAPSPSLDPNRYQVLPFHAESSVANAHIQEEYLPRFDLAERHIKQLSPTDSLSKVLHMLHVLSLMEKDIEKWKERHQFEVITTPRAVHVLYSKLFQKVEPSKELLPVAPAKWSFILLENPSKTNCFLNVALQTLFSNPELAANIVFSSHQFPEVKFAFLQYRKAAAVGIKDPLDLATMLRRLYPSFKENGHHDASEALVKIIEPADRDRAPFYSLTRTTTYAGYEPDKKAVEGLLPNGTRIQEAREAVYTIEVPDLGCVTLEEALFRSFNEVVTDPTPIAFTPADGSPPIHLPRTAVQTRYISAPKFLIFNLSLGDINRQAATPEKKVTLVGLQRTFYLSGQLTLDGKGAKYRLLSFNVHQGDSATEGHYVHYRETPEGFFAISDDVSTKISEVQYLLAAQTAYTVVLQREDHPISKEALEEGVFENRAKLSAMILTDRALQALDGAILEISSDQKRILLYLTPFIQSVIEGEPSLDAFKELPRSLQNLLLSLWSTSGNGAQMFNELDEQVEQPFSIPKTYSEEVFTGSYDLLPLMVDCLAKRLHEHPEEGTTLKSHYELIILSLGKISKERINLLKGRARMVNSLFREAMQFSLTCGAVALKLTSDNKAVTVENLKKESAVVLQSISSLTRLLFTGMDPLGENKYLQIGQQLITPTLAMTQYRQDRGTWSFAPLAPSVLNLGLSFTPVSESKKALAGNFAPLLFTDVLYPSYKSASTKTQFASLALSHLLHPNGTKDVASRLSALYGFVAQLATHRLEQHTDPDHIQTSPQGWAARTLQVVITNSALQTLVTETAAQRLSPPKALPSLSPEETLDVPERSAADSIDSLEDPQPISTPTEPKVEMQDEALFLSLAQKQEQNKATLKIAEKDLDHKKTLENEAYRKYEKRVEAYDEASVFTARKKARKWDEAEQRLKSTKKARKAAETRVATLNRKIAENAQAQLEASAPKHIVPPQQVVQAPVNRRDNKYHHLSYSDAKGQKHSLGKYDNAEDAQHIASTWGSFEVLRLSQENQCYSAQCQLVEQGMKIDDVPPRPQLEIPVLSRKDASKNHQSIQAARIRNESAVKDYLRQLEGISTQPLQVGGLTQGEIRELSQTMIPKIKDPQEHGFWYSAWRSPGKAYDATSDFLTRIGFSGGASTRPLPLYTTEPPKSTPSHIGDYGPVIPAEPAIQPIIAPSPVAQPYAAPVLHNPFLPTAPNTLPPVSMPALPQPSAPTPLTMGDGSLLPRTPLIRDVDPLSSSKPEPRGMKDLFNAAFGVVGVTVDLFSKQKKAQEFLQEVKTEIQADPVQAADNTRHGITLECGRVIKEALKFSLANTPIDHLAPTTQQKIDQLSDYVGQKYLGVLKTSGAPIDPSAATTKLGRELFYWVIPLEEGRVVQQSGKALIKGTINVLEKIGLRLNETQVERAFVKVIHKELALAEGRVAPKLTTEELTHQVEKKAVPKTAPSATKAEGSGAKTTKEIRKSEDVFVNNKELPRHPRTDEPLPEVDVPHTQLGTKEGRKGEYVQAREFDAEGKPIRDIDFTDHGRPQNHPNPHQHIYRDNLTGGTKTRVKKGHPVPEWSYE